ncbi:hypothetical protein LSUE1_G008990 [Lachnellula suecica]|uniref:Phosphoglycerate mutase n=1 Tax=Lachnellula suecica TaxID=602035 RepID=A0A8T9BS34_9HELO|nr:hypothetical protein LSUE1_G008990 [Lachnellula suecica]
MGWPPAVVIVVRHGARLDAADKQWHLTSPTPYDPPLTYGGWTQSRALGARIASILRSRETDDDIPERSGAEKGAGDRRRRRHKVIIHTSPFQRCVQTSIAISAGLAQNPGHTHHRPSSSQSTTSKASQMHSSPRSRPTVLTDSPTLNPIPEPSSKTSQKPQEQPDNIKKSTIRVDAFLGEWLTPDYFELITPPPSSIMMVAGAKADLLRKEDYSSLIHVKDVTAGVPFQGFPGGWGSPTVANNENGDGVFPKLSSLAQVLPRRDRTSSLSSAMPNVGHHTIRGRSPSATPEPDEHGIYQPPVPSYAISLSNPIPPGYVAHARDACVDVDYQWDSMRDPQHWGNGGEYGEEWSAMHKRFRKGLQQMDSWYQSDDDPSKLLPKEPPSSPGAHVEEEISDHENTDLVIILVTHGAGCNALIGALTNQPVLLDVGMASLTMAVRKSTPVNSPNISPRSSRDISKPLSISDQYDVKLVANTEHLRSSTTSTPSSSRTPSVVGMSAFQERFVSNGRAFDANKARSATTSSNFGSIRRTASIASASSMPKNYHPARQSSIGLWSAPAQDQDEEPAVPEDNVSLNFDETPTNENEPPAPAEAGEAKPEPEHEPLVAEKDKDKDEEDDVAPLGLWGSPRPPGYAEKIREIGTPKRRWTVNERTA